MTIIKINNKKSPFNESQIKSLFEEFIILENKEYLLLSEREQEKYRIDNLENLYDKFSSFIMEKAFNGKDPEDDFSYDEKEIFNEAMLYALGVGKNKLWFNEFNHEEVVRKFKNLYDYDYDNHVFQSNPENKPDVNIPEYKMRLNGCWARAFINDTFSYLSLNSIASHISFELENFANDIVDELIPNRFVEGKDNNKETEGGFLWDMKIDANGLEGQYDELVNRKYTILNDFFIRNQENFNNQAMNCIWFEYKHYEGDDSPVLNIVFSNKEILKSIEFETFEDSCKEFLVKDNRLEEIIKLQKITLKRVIEEAYNDVMKNYNPKIIKLKKKMKIVIAKDIDI
jgi:hypothetical protein